MKAINLPFFKQRLNELARELYLEHEWTLPDGLRRDGGKSPLNFTLAEWQQAKRLNLDPREIRQSFIEAWQQSDDAKSFDAALRERGYFLAKGDRRGFVALDVQGEVFAISRWTNLRTKEVRDKLGDPENLRPLDEVRQHVKGLVSDKMLGFIKDVDQRHDDELGPLNGQRKTMIETHRKERETVRAKQEERWQQEQRERSQRYNKGLRGLWDRLTGTASNVRSQNEREAMQCLIRDRDQRDDLVREQMAERRELQKQIEAVRRRHAMNRRLLAREMAQALNRTHLRDDIFSDVIGSSNIEPPVTPAATFSIDGQSAMSRSACFRMGAL